MIKIIKEEIEIEESLESRLKIICDFCNTTPTIINGSIRRVEHTNLTYIEPHRIIINDITFLVFNYFNKIFIENLNNKIKLYLKTNGGLKFMKKYNIYSLYVVEVQNGNDTQYLICKHNELSNTYVEIFTNEKVKVTNNSSVEQLSNYYSVLAQCNYTTGKPLMLDKKEILRKYITINSKVSFEKGEALFQNGNNVINVQQRVLRKDVNN